MAGLVFTGERRMDKPGDLLADDAPLELRGQDHPWVSRGGLKLAKALDHFAIRSAGRICHRRRRLDRRLHRVLLQRGAAKVYAVDVGHGQFAWKLRQDPRVVVRWSAPIREL